MTTYTAKAHTNIALLKYWGKADSQLIIPTTTSISLTLDEFYTETAVNFDASLTSDDIYINDDQITGAAGQKVVTFLNLVRQQANITDFAVVRSNNHVPTAAGLASSASAFAALAGAASAAAGISTDLTDLSRLARRGSGSASRSIFGGFVQWQRGNDDQSSVAEPIQQIIDWPIQLITVVISDQPKKINSRSGMQNAMQFSPDYPAWVKRTNAMVQPMQQAIQNHDLEMLGHMAERNALEMHAQNMMANPAFNYLTDRSWTIINTVQKLRREGILAFSTMDAGPNVKIISDPKDTETIIHALRSSVPDIQYQIATPGPGITIQQGNHLS
ncbi:diphosphomevalonate decarboxylase [Weissella diestrammenae]|uniref:diphosphomevalonate decarboxylase n=1 Tax=Weissella diestrammenae TaxID=1162633 RepID=A0A7G9T4M4_9LACO|nr:diphosphomevalonate decarboxylase [Weissella diestrammenae]MCM0582078.1 diphosphomevalonate decarboxylase [Weissella diestrammenae]QNN75049.1 diphosphomevalonate decarboxylase [Weissella diestrammenae]